VPGEHLPDETRRARVDVAVGRDEPFRDRSHASENALDSSPISAHLFPALGHGRQFG
jgi:hypothetical protein